MAWFHDIALYLVVLLIGGMIVKEIIEWFQEIKNPKKELKKEEENGKA